MNDSNSFHSRSKLRTSCEASFDASSLSFVRNDLWTRLRVITSKLLGNTFLKTKDTAFLHQIRCPELGHLYHQM